MFSCQIYINGHDLESVLAFINDYQVLRIALTIANFYFLEILAPINAVHMSSMRLSEIQGLNEIL